MVLRKLTREDIPAAKQLWMEAFGDSEEFVRYYFANKMKLKNTMGAFIKGSLAGDITMQEMLVRIRGANIKTGFLAGCATAEKHRNQGIMQRLLAAQMRAMNREGYALCHLHPFLHAFYRKFGWETVSYMYYNVQKEKNTTEIIKFPKENPKDFDRLYKMYCGFCAKADGYFIRTPREMAIRLQEHAIDGGGILETDGAYALYFEQDEGLDVIEFAWREEQDREEMLGILARSGQNIAYYTPDFCAELGEAEEYTMMRVVNVQRLLEKLQLSNCKFTIKVQDEFLPWNNVSLVCEYAQQNAKIASYSGKSPDIEADIRELARLAAGKTAGNSGPANEIFKKQRTVFFNKY